MRDKNTESTKMTKEDLIGKYDDDVYTYRGIINADGTVTDEGWLGLNTSKPIKELIANKTQDATSNN